MEDLIEQANEIQESLGRSYGVPDEVDEADLQAGQLLLSVERFQADARTRRAWIGRRADRGE